MKENMNLDTKYWNDRYINHQDGWDIDGVSPPLAQYIDQLTDKNQRILFAGAGNSHDPNYAFEKGFKNVFVCDWAQASKDSFIKRFPNFPEEQFIVGDFFDLDQKFDLLIEQTFFCALDPKIRTEYVKKVSTLLVDSGKMAGLLFYVPISSDGPPFVASKEAYIDFFKKDFEIITLEPAYNSIKPREGKELFFIIQKK